MDQKQSQAKLYLRSSLFRRLDKSNPIKGALNSVYDDEIRALTLKALKRSGKVPNIKYLNKLFCSRVASSITKISLLK